ncbi:hypothetical protein [Sorangium sp. So ce693]|uniref:hypothetical protein n=1 Tax=Sorangium sp. So ce693 TaxID=3133318 RepID=UPI003F5F034D
MKRSAGAHGMVMGVGLLMAACGPASESEIEAELDGPGLEATVIKPGSQDPNGTPKLAWHTWKLEVARWLRHPLLQNGAINPAIVVTGVFSDAGGEEVFNHTFRCAVASGTVVTYGNKPYQGRGMVSGASVWTEKGLSDDVIDNVLECVIAFVNDKKDGVHILLTGSNVNDDGGDHEGFIHGEAVWCASVGAGNVVVEVYPTRSFVRGCGIDAKAALAQRYCYQKNTCGLVYKDVLEFNAECQAVGAPGSGQYNCNGKACTMTWLEDLAPDWCDPLPPGFPQ